MTSLLTTDLRCRGGSLIICTLVWLAMVSACICDSNTDTKVVGSNPLETGFHVSPSQIPTQWATFRPFLSSPQGNFCLGFQEIMMMNSNMDHGYVLSIMYTIRVYNDSLGSETGDTNSTTFEEEPFNMEMVWSANQDIPVSANSTFSIDEEGYMALIDSDNYGSNKVNVWSPTTKSGANNTSSGGVILGQSLRLEENGNLVFSSLHNNDTMIAWQSFEHPTDTILPEQNFTASMALSASLLASATTVPLINVTFNLKMESDGMALYVTGIGRNASSDETIYWKHMADQATGLIDPSQGPIYARIARNGYLAMYQTEKSRVSYEPFNTYNSTDVSRRRMKLDNDGNIRVYYWSFPSWKVDYQGVNKLCDLPSPCGPYGICNGNTNNNMDPGIACECPHPLVRKNESNAMQGCGMSRKDDQMQCFVNDPESQLYVSLEGVQSLFQKDELINTSSGLSSKSRSASECETECNSDCECVAYFYSNMSAIRCSFAYHSALAMQNSTNDGDMAFIKIVKLPSLSSLSASPITTAIPSSFMKPHDRSHIVKIIMPIFSCVFALVLVLCLASYCLHRRRRSGTTLEEQPVLRTPPS